MCFSTEALLVLSQVMFGGDPEAALIQYTSNKEARAAISSTEAVLNNRFIRVYWHHEPTGGQQEQSQGGSQGTGLTPQHTTTHKVSLPECRHTQQGLHAYSTDVDSERVEHL